MTQNINSRTKDWKLYGGASCSRGNIPMDYPFDNKIMKVFNLS